eukprot:Blabericola_migrator_1__12944@NODE_855_length_6242_cov_81_187854_g450_i1_p7_GENE_NODE_855_length_6242_cov_81_187854_g450_i1NODE_855_length_6242_cov_81_187854_g450_i1_p7_ORF_typecomplete_len136_score24_87Kelch_4/PF13418_6/0_0051Hemopexin/PF00045_19/3e02Hemopexin/PF00045_19/0_43Kelch_6/PF13964_6/2_8e03Kelch_6/PF13964_6/0_15Kelch_3/PF13415_6/5_3e03Kelch_3/PF13415_6/0_19_NODE_855_length_6242_cov_81_187854_g450_i1226633
MCRLAYFCSGDRAFKVHIDPFNPLDNFDDGLVASEGTIQDETLQWSADPETLIAPLPRWDAAVTIRDGWLYIFGGELRAQSPEICRRFDDCWKIRVDAEKPSKWVLVYPGTYWQGFSDVGSMRSSRPDSHSVSVC